MGVGGQEWRKLGPGRGGGQVLLLLMALPRVLWTRELMRKAGKV